MKETTDSSGNVKTINVKSTDKMKTLLTTLKSIGITKGIEFLMDLYKIGVEVSK